MPPRTKKTNTFKVPEPEKPYGGGHDGLNGRWTGYPKARGPPERKGYAVALITLRKDARDEALAPFAAAANDAVARFGGQMLAGHEAHDIEVVEGTAAESRTVVAVAEFASLAKADEYLASAAHAAARALRETCSDTELLVVEGEPNGAARGWVRAGTGGAKGYVVCLSRVRDAAAFARSDAACGVALSMGGGNVLARSTANVAADATGGAELGGRAVRLYEFDTVSRAVEFYHSDEHEVAKALREACSESELLVVPAADAPRRPPPTRVAPMFEPETDTAVVEAFAEYYASLGLVQLGPVSWAGAPEASPEASPEVEAPPEGEAAAEPEAAASAAREPTPEGP